MKMVFILVWQLNDLGEQKIINFHHSLVFIALPNTKSSNIKTQFYILALETYYIIIVRDLTCSLEHCDIIT